MLLDRSIHTEIPRESAPALRKRAERLARGELPWERIERLRECWFANARRSGFAHEDAEDLFQESMLAALDGLDRIRSVNGRSPDEAFLAWFWGILRHKMISELRRRRRIRRHAEERLACNASSCSGPLATRVRGMLVLMEQRSPGGARLLRRRFMEGRELSELAAELGVSVPTAWRRVQSALEEIRGCAGVVNS